MPTIGNSKRHNVTTVGGVSQNGDFRNVTKGDCDGSEKCSKPNGENECDVVTDKNADHASKHNFSGAKELGIDRPATDDADASGDAEEGDLA